MADYSYTDGQGLDQLDSATPNGATEPVSILDDAVRQIKAYLKDPLVGPKALIDALLPVGYINMFAGSAAPSGYLICDGSAVSRSTYANLFALLGTTYGAGNGTTTFNIPDFRGRVPVGVGTGDATTATSWSLAQKKGNEDVSLVLNQLPSHSHLTVKSGATVTPNVNATDPSSEYMAGGHLNSGSGTADSSPSSSVGNASPVGLIQPSIGINFIIKY
jgi:microcystin-dependent protein